MTAAAQLPITLDLPGRGAALETAAGTATARPATSPRVLGLDLSLSCTGIAGAGWTATIAYPPRKKHQGRTDYAHQRIAHIVATLTDRHLRGVDLAVIEGASYASPDQGHQLAGLRWAVRHQLWKLGIPYAVVPPSTLKMYATNNGGASKAVVTAAVRGWFGWFDGGSDEADAAALWAMGRDWLGAAACPTPPRRAEALAGCEWPERVGL